MIIGIDATQSLTQYGAIGLNGADGPCSILIKNFWNLDDILSLCMPLVNHKTPKVDGALSESYNGIVSSCIFLLFINCLKSSSAL